MLLLKVSQKKPKSIDQYTRHFWPICLRFILPDVEITSPSTTKLTTLNNILSMMAPDHGLNTNVTVFFLSITFVLMFITIWLSFQNLCK